jgi:hypothetical protein
MREINDWRLTNQLEYLRGVALEWKEYSPHRKDWEHEHCAFCWAKFMAVDQVDVQRGGWATPDGAHWVCPTCFDDFRDLFAWKVSIQ